jgi:toxin FitB
MYLVDTNVISEALRRMPDARVLQWLAAVSAKARRLCLSVITVEEVIYGLSRKAMPGLLERFEGLLLASDVLGLDAQAARCAAELRGRFAARGIVRSQPDMLIAATAQLHGLTVVTRNVRDFEGCGIGLLNPFTEP